MALATIAFAVLCAAALPFPASADEVSSGRAAEALALCLAVDAGPADGKLARLESLGGGVTIAEAAVAADPSDPRAHFALFCNLGKQLELAGLSWRSLSRLERMRRVLDTAQALAPDDPDILTAKGELLRRLPSLLGGDRDEAERLLRRALDARAGHVAARLFLARLLAERGASDAPREARLALVAADRAGTPAERADARALVERFAR